MNTLVALTTTFLPGWPTAQPLSAFQLFMLCLGGPIVVAAIIFGLGLGFGRRKELADDQRSAGLAVQPHRAQEAVVTATPQRALVEDDRSTGAHAAH